MILEIMKIVRSLVARSVVEFREDRTDLDTKVTDIFTPNKSREEDSSLIFSSSSNEAYYF